jgi:hypothetical protein
MKIQSQRNLGPVLGSVTLRMLAALAFLAMNLIGYRAFSQEMTSSASRWSGAKGSAGAQSTLVSSKGSLDDKSVRPEVHSTLPACQLATEGYVANQWRNVRIHVGQAVVAGVESLAELGSQIKKLVIDKKCSPLAVPCHLASEGFAMGSWVKHRILVKGEVAFGGDTTARLFSQLAELRRIGICLDDN